MALFRFWKTPYERATTSFDRKCREWDANYLHLRKSLEQTWLVKTLKVEIDFDLLIWIDCLLGFNEQDAERHLILANAIIPIFAYFIVKPWSLKDKYPEAMPVFYYCWIIFMIYEFINYLWLSKSDKKCVKQVDCLPGFNKEDAKIRQIILASLFIPIVACFIVKPWSLKDTFPEAMYIFHFCWIMFMTYEFINLFWFSTIQKFVKKNSAKYKALFNAYQKLSSNYDSLKKQHTLSEKQVKYLKNVLTSRDIRVNTYFLRDDLEGIALLDLELNMMTANSSQKEEKQTNENLESSTDKAFSEPAKIPSNPSVTNPTIVVDEVANTGGTDLHADTESVKFVAESKTVQFSAVCKTGELAEDDLKAQQDFKECEWEIIDEIIH